MSKTTSDSSLPSGGGGVEREARLVVARRGAGRCPFRQRRRPVRVETYILSFPAHVLSFLLRSVSLSFTYIDFSFPSVKHAGCRRWVRRRVTSFHAATPSCSSLTHILSQVEFVFTYIEFFIHIYSVFHSRNMNCWLSSLGEEPGDVFSVMNAVLLGFWV